MHEEVVETIDTTLVTEQIDTMMEIITENQLNSEGATLEVLENILAQLSSLNTWIMFFVWFIVVLFCGFVAWAIMKFIVLRTLRRFIKFRI